MANVFETTCPHCGETIQVEAPVKERKPRGQLAGIALEDMTDEQLKRELINSKSVLYKATQRGAGEATIAANQARVDAAVAEKEKRQALKKAEKAEEASEEVYDEATDSVDEETAAEI